MGPCYSAYMGNPSRRSARILCTPERRPSSSGRVGKSQAVRNSLRVCVSFNGFGNEDSRIVSNADSRQVHSRIEAKDRIEVELRDPKTPDEAYRLADRFDRIVYGIRNNSFLTQNYNRYTPTSGASSNTDYGESMQIDILRPHRPGQKNFQRPHDQSFQRLRNQGLCFTCEKPGHIATNCPDRQGQFRKRNQQRKGRRQ